MPGYTGVVASANLSYTLRGASRFTFTAIHDLAYSYNETEPYYVIGGYGVSVTHHLGGRFDARAGGDWQAYRYQRLTLLPDASSTLALEPPQTINHMRIWSAGLGYRLWRTQRLGLGATYRQRDASSQPELAYSGLRLMVTVDSAQ